MTVGSVMFLDGKPELTVTSTWCKFLHSRTRYVASLLTDWSGSCVQMDTVFAYWSVDCMWITFGGYL